MHLELVTAISTASAAAGSAAIAATNDSLTIKNGKGPISILAAWASMNATAGFIQIVWPSAHDTTRGYRGVAPAGPIATFGAGSLLTPLGFDMRLESQETVAVTISGGAIAGDVDNMSMLIAYDDFPGINARLIDAAEADRRAEKYTTLVATVADAGTGLGYNEEAINVDSDLLKANRDYAVLGMTCQSAAHALTLFGPDIGNVRVGVPGMLRPEITSQWFAITSRASNRRTIPVINSGNKAQTLIGFKGDENGASRVVTMHLALLK